MWNVHLNILPRYIGLRFTMAVRPRTRLISPKNKLFEIIFSKAYVMPRRVVYGTVFLIINSFLDGIFFRSLKKSILCGYEEVKFDHREWSAVGSGVFIFLGPEGIGNLEEILDYFLKKKKVVKHRVRNMHVERNSLRIQAYPWSPSDCFFRIQQRRGGWNQ